MAAAAAASGAGGAVDVLDPMQAEDAARRKRIREAFELFDKDANGTVVRECVVGCVAARCSSQRLTRSRGSPDREVPTILRYLGVFPPESELAELIDSMHDDEPTAYVEYDRFEARTLQLIKDGTYAPDAEETLLAAFRVRPVRFHM